MAVRLTVSEAEHAELSAELQSLYVRNADGSFALDVDRADGDALQRALRAERELRKGAEHKAKEHARTLADIQSGSAAFAAAQAERDALARKAAALQGRLLDEAVDRAASAAGVHTAALPDARRAAREAFTVDDTGAVVARDSSGKFRDVASWVADLRETAPHYFPAPSGMSAPSNRVRSDAGGTTMTRARFEALATGERSALIAQGYTIVD